MPVDTLTPVEFLREAWEDFKSPTTSNFVDKLGACRSTVQALEEVGVAMLSMTN